MTLHDFKNNLAEIFSEKETTNKWHQWIDNSIMGLLVLNAVVIFLSTYDSIQAQIGGLLNVVDIIITSIFFVEVSMRIWVADLVDPQYKGFWGRVRYCFTPYGLIDILSTYPSVIGWFGGFTPVVLKSLRVLRLLRIFRFMDSFDLLSNAIKNKKQEMFLSFSFLAVVTFVLSLILYYVEHAANPEQYTNGMDSVIWAFMQYIGDPGGFAEVAPTTLTGRVISCLVGILGIAVFAVPAGLIGSGFIEEVQKKNKADEIVANRERIRPLFERKLCRFSQFQTVPIHVPITDLQVHTRLTVEEILDVVDQSKDLRLVNLAQTQLIEDHPVDRLAVEHFVVNTPYGCKIDRDSKVTIVVTSSYVEPAMGNWGYYLAKIGGFNFISREVGVARPYKSYYTFADTSVDPHLPQFMADLDAMASGADHWVFYVLAASGGNEVALPTEVHFNYGGKKGDETYNDPNITLHDMQRFEAFFQDIEKELLAEYEIGSDKQRYYDTSSPNNIMRKLAHADKVNSISLRVAWRITCWDLRKIAIAKTLADAFNRHFEADVKKTYSADLKVKAIGFEDYVD